MRLSSPLLTASFAVAALVGATSSCFALRVTGQENSLLAHAHKAADFKLTVVDPKHPNYAHSYYWLSASRLLHCYCLDEPGMGLRMVTQQIDLHTGQHTALTTPVDNLDMGQVEEGPRKCWLIRNLVHSSGTFTIAQKGDGTAEWQTHFGVPPTYIWNQDGHHIYETFPKSPGRTLLIERDLERPAYSRRFWASGSASKDMRYTAAALNTHYSAQDIVTRSGYLMLFKVVPARRINDTAQQQGIVSMARLGRKITTTRRYRLRLPANQQGTLEFSPDGSRLLWTLWPQNVRQENPSCVYTYWISDLDSTHKRRLGATPIDNASIQGVTQLQWLPDSRHIGFLYKNELYAVATQ